MNTPERTVHEIVTRPDGTQDLVPLARVEPPPRPPGVLTGKQARALRNLILLKLLTMDREEARNE